MSRVLTPAPPACTVEFDQFSVTLLLKQSVAGGSSSSCHTQPRRWWAWCCSEGTVWGSCAIQERDNMAHAVPKSLLGWCRGQCCSGRAALHSQVTRQTCLNHLICVIATTLSVKLRTVHITIILSTIAVGTACWYGILNCIDTNPALVFPGAQWDHSLWLAPSEDWLPAWPSRAGSLSTESVLPLTGCTLQSKP